LIKLANSFGIGGDYMVMPQDVPPLMRAIECYKICFESSTTISPGDYQQPVQLPFIYEMHQLLEKPMDLYLVVPSSMSVDPKDLDNFLEFYPLWKKHRNIKFNILDIFDFLSKFHQSSFINREKSLQSCDILF